MIPLETLVKEAKRAAELSYSPYSHFRVGACVEVDGDMWFSGTNIENASYGLTICAERVAIVKAVSHGYTKLKRVVVYAPSQTVRTGPCGACRQFIEEFAGGDTYIHGVCDTDETLVWTIEDLLPQAFGPDNLLKRKMSKEQIQESIARIESAVPWEHEEKANYGVECLREEFRQRLYGTQDVGSNNSLEKK